MTKDIKNLTSSALKKENKALDGKREFEVEINGAKYKLTHDITFRKTKQANLMDDVIAFFSEGMKRPEILELATPYTALMIIKYFTSLDISDDISEALETLDVLVDLEILEKIIVELPEDEITKIYQLLDKTVKNMNETLEEAEQDAKELATKIENNELKDMISNG